MAVNLILTRDDDGIVHLYQMLDGSATPVEIALPDSLTSIPRRPCQVEDRLRRRYIVGCFDTPAIMTEFNTLHRAGISAPGAAPTLAAAGGGTLSGNHVGYISFRHKNGDTIIHEGNLSDPSSTVSLNGSQQRQWTLPGSSPDARVTHVVLWVSVDGALPKEVTELAIATTTHTENTATAALGDPPPVDEEGNLKQARGVPPKAFLVIKYHRRAWYNDPQFPARWWYTELDEFESVGDQNFIEHLEHEEIVGAGATDDLFFSGGADVSYAIQGWDEADFRIYRLDPEVGVISHFGILAINGNLWVPTPLGVYLFVSGGRFFPLMHTTLQTFWADEYEANPDAFEDCFAANDPVSHVYKLLIPYATVPLARYFVGHYSDFDPAIGGGESLPDWTFDYRNRKDYTMGVLRPPGTKRADFYTGSCDGFIRKENVDDNDDDDGDSYGKLMQFDTPHYMPSGQGGEDDQAWEFNDLDLFIQSDLKDWTIEARAGDDTAWQATNPAWSQTIRASGLTVGSKTAVAQTAHHFTPVGVSGKGVTYRVKIPKAKRAEFRGLAHAWVEGLQARPFI